MDTPGDDVLAELSSVAGAVECPEKIQEDLKEKNANRLENPRTELRIGVNPGDGINDEGKVYGEGVDVPARIEGQAQKRGICISGTALDKVEGKRGLEFEYP